MKLRSAIPLSGFILFAAYMLLSLAIGEQHPFSRYPMYNQFPNHAEVYFLKDKHGNTVVLQKYFTLKADELGHLPAGVSARQNMSYDSLLYSAAGREVLGRHLLHHVMQRAMPGLPFDTLQVWYKQYNCKGYLIQQHEQLLYAGAAQ